MKRVMVLALLVAGGCHSSAEEQRLAAALALCERDRDAPRVAQAARLAAHNAQMVDMEREVAKARDDAARLPRWMRHRPYPTEMFDAIANEMTTAQVFDLLKAPGEVRSSGAAAGITNEVRVWKNDDGSSIVVVFQNGRVINKAQSGLRR